MKFALYGSRALSNGKSNVNCVIMAGILCLKHDETVLC